jgi:plastocyanin
MLPRVRPMKMRRKVLRLAVVGWASGALAVAAAAQAPAVRPPVTHALTGRLELMENGRRATDRSLDLTQAVVWFEPARPEPVAPAVGVEMSTLRKQFTPRTVVVPVGSSVAFSNQDPILHNAFSVSGRNGFDVGLVGKGGGKSVTFNEPGIVRVFCNVHHAMFANVVVVPTPYYAAPDTSGSFRLEGVPAGPGKLSFWHERGEVVSLPLSVPARGALNLTFDVTQPRIPPHRNKYGRAYKRGAYD